MTLRSALLGAACALVFSGAAEAAQVNGWYVSLEGGANWVEDWAHTITFTGGPASFLAEASFDTGFAVLGSVGYGWDGWRAEIEAGYRSNDVDSYAISGIVFTAVNADLWEGSLMANVLYDFELTDNLGISLGAGVGGDFSNVDVTLGALNFEDDDWNLAYQGIAGITYAVGRQTSLFLNYRYLRVVDAEFDFRPTFPAVLVNGDDLVKHTATFGIRYALTAPSVMTDMTPTAPPPEPAMSVPRQFIVFFGFNKYNLTSEALRVISEAVVAAKDTGSATVLITGHTDTVGSNDYNMRLSMRRSNAVKAEMVRQGIPTSAISSTGKGETELLVQTADGVKEPQNRRATIDLN